jgi:hypothetical protein
LQTQFTTQRSKTIIDIIASVTLTTLAVLFPAILITASPLGRTARGRLAAVLLLWFALVAALAAAGLFSTMSAGTPAFGVAIVVPIIVGLIVFRRSAALKSLVSETPLALLVAVHTGRLLGVFFLLLYAEVRLPPTFALTAGWGDIGVAAAAPVVAWAIHRRAVCWRGLALTWNTLGFADLVLAVTLGVGSAVDSPVRFIYEAASSGTMSTLPWILVPGFMVPLYLMTHLAIFSRLFVAAQNFRERSSERRHLISEIQGRNKWGLASVVLTSPMLQPARTTCPSRAKATRLSSRSAGCASPWPLCRSCSRLFMLFSCCWLRTPNMGIPIVGSFRV